MALIQGFIFAEKFYDDVNFPRGFGKSGDFTIAEAELLVNLGRRLFKLEQGLCKPENQVEAQFAQMSESLLGGQTKVELLWQKYKKLTRHKPFNSLTGQH